MRTIVFGFTLLCMWSCARTNLPNGRAFKSESMHMFGPTELRFEDSSFVLTERAGMMYTTGSWKLAEDRSGIVLNSEVNTKGPFVGDGAVYFVLKDEFIKMTGRHKLVYKDVILDDRN